jgi:hypothetical protein
VVADKIKVALGTNLVGGASVEVERLALPLALNHPLNERHWPTPYDGLLDGRVKHPPRGLMGDKRKRSHLSTGGRRRLVLLLPLLDELLLLLGARQFTDDGGFFTADRTRRCVSPDYVRFLDRVEVRKRSRMGVDEDLCGERLTRRSCYEREEALCVRVKRIRG